MTTDATGDGATASDPVETSVTHPDGGTITIEETPISEPAPTGFQFLGQQVNISAPAASAADPLVIEFRVHTSIAGNDPDAVAIFKGGSLVGPCTGDPGEAAPDPCLESSSLDDDELVFVVLTSSASAWNVGVATTPALTPTATPTPTPAAIQPPPGVCSAPGLANLAARAPEAATKLEVSCTEGFSLGDFIRINPGGANQEDHQIAGMGSLILAEPLQFTHEAGEPVVKMSDASGLSPAPAEATQAGPSSFGSTGGPPPSAARELSVLVAIFGIIAAVAGSAGFVWWTSRRQA